MLKQNRDRRLLLASLLAITPLARAAGPAPAHENAMAPLPPAEKDGAFCNFQEVKHCQTDVTPTEVLQHFKEGNARFVAGQHLHRNYRVGVRKTAADQFPLASVLSCIDSRAPAELVFDQGIGDLFNARVAGNVVNDDVLGSLEYAHQAKGAKLLVVMGHTGCGAIKGACDDVHLGHLTGLLARIKPVAAAVPGDIADRSSANHAFVDQVAERNVQATLQAIQEQSPILREMAQRGELLMVGAMYDVATGEVHWASEPRANPAHGQG